MKILFRSVSYIGEYFTLTFPFSYIGVGGGRKYFRGKKEGAWEKGNEKKVRGGEKAIEGQGQKRKEGW